MKKLLSSIMASAMILSTLSVGAMAQETTAIAEQMETQTLAGVAGGYSTDFAAADEGDWSGTSYGSSAFLNQYFGSGGAVTVPSTLAGASVEQVEFYYDIDITSFIIPDTVKMIDLSCTTIETLYIPRSMQQCYASAESISTVYYEGTEAEFENTCYVSSWKGEQPTIIYNATMPNGSTSTPNSTPESSGYPDWATTFVEFAEANFMPDISPENYGTASNRGLIAQSFYNMYANGTDLLATHSFTDVGEFEDAIAWCFENEVMSGTGSTTFGTYGNVNREQFCLILKQMATVLEKNGVDGDVSALHDFSDADSISAWAEEGVAWAVSNGLMAGSNGALNPHGDVTRLEVAIMLMALDNL